MSQIPDSLAEEKKESFIMFPKTLLQDFEYTYRELDLLHLTIIKSLANNFTNTAVISVNDLITIMGINFKNKEVNQKVKESLVRLQKMKYIIIYADKSKLESILNLKSAQTYFIQPTKVNEDVFIKVFDSDLDKIVAIDSKYKPKLYIIYLGIVSYIWYHQDLTKVDKAVYPNIDTLADLVDLDRRTVMKYIKILQDAEVIYSVTTRVNYRKNKNFYGRYKHKELIEREARTNTAVLQNCEDKEVNLVIGIE